MCENGYRNTFFLKRLFSLRPYRPEEAQAGFFAGFLPKGHPLARGRQEQRIVAGNLLDQDFRQGGIGLRVVTQAQYQDDAQDQGQETRQDRAHIEDRVGQDRIAIPLIGVLPPVVFELISLSAQIGLPLLQVPLQGNDSPRALASA